MIDSATGATANLGLRVLTLVGARHVLGECPLYDVHRDEKTLANRALRFPNGILSPADRLGLPEVALPAFQSCTLRRLVGGPNAGAFERAPDDRSPLLPDSLVLVNQRSTSAAPDVVG